MMTRFSDSFWSPEYCNFAGFEVLCRRMQSGKQMLKAYAEFLKQKAQAQDTYGRTLIRLAHNAGGKDEIGSLKQGWNSLCCQTEVIGLAHLDAARSLTEQAECMLEILEFQKDQRRRMENDVRKSQTNLKVHYKKTLDCKKHFDIKYKEKLSLSQNQDNASYSGSQKEIEKLSQKRAKTCQMAELADATYKGALENLDVAYSEWEKRTTAACDLFQLLEEERISVLRNSMWVVTNVGSSVCVKEDVALEEVRKNLETCDVFNDIEYFIQTNCVGSVKPGRIAYGSDMSPQVVSDRLIPPFKISNLTLKLEDIPQFFSRSVVKDSDPDASSISNGVYESIDELGIQPQIRHDYRVKYDFEGKNPDELSLKTNEVVQLLYKESDEWWKIQTRNGLQGFFPAHYLEIR